MTDRCRFSNAGTVFRRPAANSRRRGSSTGLSQSTDQSHRGAESCPSLLPTSGIVGIAHGSSGRRFAPGSKLSRIVGYSLCRALRSRSMKNCGTASGFRPAPAISKAIQWSFGPTTSTGRTPPRASSTTAILRRRLSPRSATSGTGLSQLPTATCKSTRRPWRWMTLATRWSPGPRRRSTATRTCGRDDSTRTGMPSARPSPSRPGRGCGNTSPRWEWIGMATSWSATRLSGRSASASFP